MTVHERAEKYADNFLDADELTRQDIVRDYSTGFRDAIALAAENAHIIDRGYWDGYKLSYFIRTLAEPSQDGTGEQ